MSSKGTIHKWASGWNSPGLPGRVFLSKEALVTTMIKADLNPEHQAEEVPSGSLIDKWIEYCARKRASIETVKKGTDILIRLDPDEAEYYAENGFDGLLASVETPVKYQALAKKRKKKSKKPEDRFPRDGRGAGEGRPGGGRAGRNLGPCGLKGDEKGPGYGKGKGRGKGRGRLDINPK